MTPLDLAMQLLKEEPLFLQGSNTLARRARKELETDMTGANSPAYQEMMERLMDIYEPQDETISLEDNLDQYAQETGKNPWRSLPGREMPNKHGGNVKVHLAPFTPIHTQPFYDWQAKNASEPMDIAFQMLKAPYLPPSYTEVSQYQMPNQPDWAKNAQGVFVHPDMPQVQYRMSITYMGKDPYVEVEHPDTGETIAHGTFRYEPHPYDEQEPGHFVSDDTWVHEDHRGKRMGPAMYNFLVNQMERLQGPEVKGSEHMTKPGERMWEREQGTAEPGTPWRRTI